MRSPVLICLFALLCITTLSAVSADIVYRNPRIFNVSYSFEFAPDPAKIDRAKDLKLWLPIPRDWDTQREVKILSVDPPPHGVSQVVDNPRNPRGLLILYAALTGEGMLHLWDVFPYEADASYVIFDHEKWIVSGCWEDMDSDLVWKFEVDEAGGKD